MAEEKRADRPEEETGVALALPADDLDMEIRRFFGIGEVDERTYSPLTLAYIGDCIFDLVIRSIIVGRGNTRPARLHQRASSIVKASTQSAMIRALEPELTEEEAAVYRRGRNAKSYTTAKNASVRDYRRATGFEALLGHLYLTHRFSRVMELAKLGLERLGIQL